MSDENLIYYASILSIIYYVFVEAAAAQAKSLGFDPHKVFVPHPIQDRTDEEMQLIAENVFDEVLALILNK